MRPLPPRDDEVTALMVAGYTNASIARQLGLRLCQVETYSNRIYNRLGIETQDEGRNPRVMLARRVLLKERA